MQLTKAQQQLIADATDAGYTVEINATSVDIFKAKKGRIQSGIRIYEDKTAYRLDLDLGSALTIRTQKAMRTALGI